MSRRPIPMRASALALALLVVGVIAPSAAHASAFRYWTYWRAEAGSWAFATQGPATTIPKDGSVEGWRFAVTTQVGSPADEPAIAPDFDAICGATVASEGSKRVGLVLDFGTAAIAPSGQSAPTPVATCVVVPSDASGFQVLESVAAVRTEGGLICSLAGYPQGECAPLLDDAQVAAIAAAADASTPPASPAPAATAAPAPPASDTGSPIATIAVAAVLIVGGAVAVVARRRGSPRA